MNSTLPIVETFHSLQAEGLHFGISAFFIRLGGCKVGCPWCDTKESWPMKGHQKESIFNIAQKATEAQSKGASIIVITGGEPLHHNLNPLCKAIKIATSGNSNQSIPIHLETSGVDPLTGDIDWLTLSPKRHAPPRPDIIEACQELKIVINSKEDLLFAETITRELKQDVLHKKLLFLQPGWENAKGQQLAVEYIKKHSQWRLSMQTHKWLGVL